MSKDVTPQRWFSNWRFAARPPRDDPADYGTAFGLDLSMEECPDAAPAAPPGDRRAGWVRRLADRRKRST
jgi:hypothetical protein